MTTVFGDDSSRDDQGRQEDTRDEAREDDARAFREGIEEDGCESGDERDEELDDGDDEGFAAEDNVDDEDEVDEDDQPDVNLGGDSHDELEDDDEADEDGEAEDYEAEDYLDDELDGSDADLDGDETDFSTVATGGSIDEAKRKALDQLRKIVPLVREDDVEYLVVEEGGRSGFLGMGSRVSAQVEARLRPSAGAPAVDTEEGAVAKDVAGFLRTVVDLMGLEATVNVSDDGESVVAELAGPDLGILIGRHGQTIDALQYLAMIAANRSHQDRRRVIVDAEGYRQRREVSLHAIADRTAQKVARERAPITLKPMTAAERKVVHLRLKDHPRVQTSSEGQEPNRAVVVEPRTRA